jgi:hypothetical protein
VRHGCIPVIIMDGVHMPFEGVLDYATFSIRVPERHLEQLDTLLRAVTPQRQAASPLLLYTYYGHADRLLLHDHVLLLSTYY